MFQVYSKVIQLYLLPGSCVHEILQARILECAAMPSSKGPSLPRDWTQVSYASCNQAPPSNDSLSFRNCKEMGLDGDDITNIQFRSSNNSEYFINP